MGEYMIILDELIEFLKALIVAIGYPILECLNQFFYLFNDVYMFIRACITFIISIWDIILDIFELGLNLFMPAPWIVLWIIMLSLLIAKYIRNQLGDIEIFGFKIGKGGNGGRDWPF